MRNNYRMNVCGLFGAFLLLFSGGALSAVAQEASEEHIFTPQFTEMTIPQNVDIVVMIKDYNDAMKTQCYDQGERAVVRYVSEDPTIIEGHDGRFDSMDKTGTTTVEMQISTPLAGTMDSFDEDNIIARANIEVTVVETTAYKIQKPNFVAQLPVSKEEVRRQMTEEMGATLFTDQYIAMHPSAAGENLDLYLMDNPLFPVVLYYFEDDQLCTEFAVYVSYLGGILSESGLALQTIINDWGYEYHGMSELSGGANLYDPEHLNWATTAFVLSVGQAFGCLSHVYDPYRIYLPIETIITPETPMVYTDATTHSIRVVATDAQSGAEVSIFTPSGVRVAGAQLLDGETRIEDLPSGVLFVKISGAPSVKVLL